MLQFNPGQLYFLGREASDRLQQAAKLGLEGSDQAFDLTIRTVQFHVDAMTRLMTQTSHVKDIASLRQLWSELFDLMRESVATSNASQKQTIEMALKATELFYTNIFEQSSATKSGAKPKAGAAAAPSPASPRAARSGKR
ncbi:MAG: hypothetical protein JSS16_05770 [Proteobacteria bacterium]|uniref:hypothetical protein n=1 Tax=Rudaea sp. TaxID=2136325 RepID=UPI001D4C5753|nr:hypothetical protein [Pseudomonadota bacterium]MBS0567339.1 hypothetical protein [Pseudomonadota bacterium]